MDTASEAASSAELLRDAAAGDANAWNALTERFANLVWSVARSFRLDAADAADVAQTTWLRLIENLDRIKEPERVGAWLATTARRESLRALRLAGREQVTADQAVFDVTDREQPAVDSGLLVAERDVALWQGFAQLGNRCQALLRLVAADPPVPYRKVSELLGMPLGAIGPTRARCLNRLRGILSATDGTPAAGSG
jgi:RNA polymerase sigma factor (sigma-70 family)